MGCKGKCPIWPQDQKSAVSNKDSKGKCYIWPQAPRLRNQQFLLRILKENALSGAVLRNQRFLIRILKENAPSGPGLRFQSFPILQGAKNKENLKKIKVWGQVGSENDECLSYSARFYPNLAE